MSRIIVLTGGVGGAKLVRGLTELKLPDRITAIVNIGDDFRHLGLAISPDIDTLLYTLSGKASILRGWGREDESWSFMAALHELGGPDWFQLGDRDLALHIVRTMRLAAGESLSQVTADLARRFGIGIDILPMSNDPVCTIVETAEGPLAFQDYFVARRCAPAIRGIRFDGAEHATPTPGILAAIVDPSVRAILVAPSNPYLSIDPILSVPAIRKALSIAGAPVVAVSPIVNGEAVKGPTAKIMAELGIPRTDAAIAAHYRDIIDGLLVSQPMESDITHAVADIMMNDCADRMRVATDALALAARIGKAV
jgi:LPPG:FO 2-phospho-L-lactate transferase